MATKTNNKQKRSKNCARGNQKSFNKNRNKEFSRDTQTNYPNSNENYSNDWKWYAADESIIRGAASINWSWSTGTPISSVLGGYTVPGIAVMELKPSVGFSSNPSSPINVAANTVYSFVRHANSGHSNYDAPDLMMYLIAMSQVYSYINSLQRMYGVAQVYSQKNRYFPDFILNALGADAESVKTDQAKFRYGINMLVNKAASFAIPANMPYFNRQAFLYTGLYTEGSSIKDQLYAFVPDSFYKYDENLSHPEQGGRLKYKGFWNENHRYTVDELIAYGNELLNVLISSEDINIMSGDILKAYGQDGIIKLMSVPEDYVVTPTFDITVLEQFKNARILPTLVTETTPNGDGEVYQESKDYSPYLVSVPTSKKGSIFAGDFKPDRDVYKCDYLLTTSVADPGPEVTVENTRLAPALIDLVEKQGELIFGIGACSEIPMGLTILGYSYNNGTRTVKSAHISECVEYVISQSQVDLNLSYEGMSSAFHYLPYYYMAIGSTDESAGMKTHYASDVQLIAQLDNYAVLDNKELAQIHEAALLNMLHVDTIAKIQS